MPIDFSDMMDDGAGPVVHPRDIFFTLNRHSNFSFPRDIQTEVMNSWFDQRAVTDKVVKLNVGSGKTLVGLLLLQSSLHENLGPALYISPNVQLSQQVMREAQALGISFTDDPTDPSYQAGERICVVNIYKLFNGRSVFGVGTSQIGIGSVVVDDAHACVSTIADQFRIKLPNTHASYQEIFQILSEDLKGYSEPRFLDIEAGDPRVHLEVPFWSWANHQSKLLRALHRHRTDELLRFTYPLVRDVLPQCRCIMGGQYLEIEPYFPATDVIQSFRRARRRIYMTATLSDDSVIVTHFGGDPKRLAQPIVPSSSQSMGERMILMPQELNPDFTLKDMQALMKHLSTAVNVVVIVPSFASADHWKGIASQILSGNDVTTGVERLRENHVGLTVLVNRYDGIDLPSDACRVLAIVDLPEVASYSDLVDGEVLSHSTVSLRRHIERIEQGMGRGIRSNDDYCAVVLFGSRLTGRLRSPEAQSMLTPATKAQLDLARRIANKLSNPSLEDVRDVILQCLRRDTAWITVSKRILLNIDSNTELRLDSAKLAMRQAFDFSRANQHEQAASVLDGAINATNEPQVKAWILSRKAALQHHFDADGAQKTLLAAHSMEPSVLRPMHGATYRKLAPATGQQAAALISFHQKRFLDATAMRLYADELCSDLQFVSVSSGKFETAVDDLARFIGISGQRPEKEYREGPDNLWALASGKFLVIECKNGVTGSGGISKSDAAQLGQGVAWFKSRYPVSEYVPIIIHPERTLGLGASVVEGMRVIQQSHLEKLRDRLREFSKQLASPDVSTVTTEVV